MAFKGISNELLQHRMSEGRLFQVKTDECLCKRCYEFTSSAAAK